MCVSRRARPSPASGSEVRIEEAQQVGHRRADRSRPGQRREGPTRHRQAPSGVAGTQAPLLFLGEADGGGVAEPQRRAEVVPHGVPVVESQTAGEDVPEHAHADDGFGVLSRRRVLGVVAPQEGPEQLRAVVAVGVGRVLLWGPQVRRVVRHAGGVRRELLERDAASALIREERLGEQLLQGRIEPRLAPVHQQGEEGAGEDLGEKAQLVQGIRGGGCPLVTEGLHVVHSAVGDAHAQCRRGGRAQVAPGGVEDCLGGRAGGIRHGRGALGQRTRTAPAYEVSCPPRCPKRGFPLPQFASQEVSCSYRTAPVRWWCSRVSACDDSGPPRSATGS